LLLLFIYMPRVSEELWEHLQSNSQNEVPEFPVYNKAFHDPDVELEFEVTLPAARAVRKFTDRKDLAEINGKLCFRFA